MTLEQLRIFVAVAEREHMTRAAADLRLTQSATSAAVAALEARYATRLFDRVGRRIQLTDVGRIFLAEALAVLRRAEAAELVLADLAGLKVGSLALAASQTVGNYWLPAVIQTFQAAYPGLSVGLTLGNTETVATMVKDGGARLGFVEGVVSDSALKATAIAGDEMVLVVSAKHPWARAGEDIDLTKGRWVLREHGSGTRFMVEELIRRRGHKVSDLDIGLVLPSNEAVRAAVEAGGGATVISRLVVESALKAGSLVAVDCALPQRQFFILQHKDHHVTAAEREFVRMVDGVSAR